MSRTNNDFEGFPLNTEDIEQIITDPGSLLDSTNLLGFGDEGMNIGVPDTTSIHTMYNPQLPNGTAVRPAPPSRPRRPENRPGEPWVEIVEQPKQRGLRFRYQCEGRSAGSIPGEHSTNEKKTFPTIKIHNYKGQAIIVVSCVTKDPEPHCKPHPHSLVGRDCKKGVCTVRVKDASVVSFPQLGIQCAKKKDVEGALSLRKEINVDPYQTGFDHASSNIDLNVVRLCFQVFLPDASGQVTRVVPPVSSHPIHDKKALNDLVICRVDKSSGRARGGDEVFLLCEKVGKDDIRVRFFEEENGEPVWESFGDFGQGDVHRQYAIVFKTPKYREEYITRPVNVSMQLMRPSDGELSDAIQFTYMPEDPDPDRIEEKRKRKGDWLNRVITSSGSSDGHSSSNSSVKESLRHKLKANRRIKQETTMETDPQGGTSMSSRGSCSSLEPLSSTSPSFSRDTSIVHVISNPPGQMQQPFAVGAAKMAQQIQHSQQLQQQQHPQHPATMMSGTSGASGGSQPGSLDSLLNFLSNTPILPSELLSAIDPSAIQSLLDSNVSFSSASDAGGSSHLGDTAHDPGSHSLASAIHNGMIGMDTDQRAQFLEVQAALEALNKSS
ncbi:hypothetical protein C0Q70_13643 [Pomacea canaliculata]|uniref:RHD domain-containing protein n=1 Tax=Pomacea canaliculata TaxID=400727 RepID=A0A2T7NXU8_POMCA|nr:putative transcription factor p65 homolog isoform X2 [Pomacea canaliculata]PVD25976.1 hypothetical protein C0Q70_13643 [Pomacea canaliculata]